MAGAYSATVFVIVPVNNIMARVLDAPMATIGGKNALGVGLHRALAGDAVADIAGILAAFLMRKFAFDDKSLSDVGKIQVVV